MKRNINDTKNVAITPIINLNKCESDGRCLAVYPIDVLVIHEINDYKTFSLIGKFKTKIHGRRKAFVLNPNDCVACGKCVKICTENAIKLNKLN